MSIEIEIKLAFNDSVSASMLEVLESILKRLECNTQYSKKELKNTYFDTPNFSLNNNKVALRIRQYTTSQGVKVFIQTFKTAGHSVDGLSQRGEWEWRLAENKLDLAQLQQCEAWPDNVDTDNLVTLFETNFTRYTFNVGWVASVIELVLDWGEIRSNQQQEKIHEIELELKQGNQHDLKALAAVLMESLPLSASDVSKAERGVRLFQTSK